MQLLEKPKLKAAVSTPSVVLPKQQTTKLIGELGGNFGTQSYGMLRHATRHFFSDGEKHSDLCFPLNIQCIIDRFDLRITGRVFRRSNSVRPSVIIRRSLGALAGFSFDFPFPLLIVCIYVCAGDGLWGEHNPHFGTNKTGDARW